MELRKEKKRSLILNMTSLIDVLFLLLIFFIVSTTFLSQPAIKLELPTAKNADVVRQKSLVLYIDNNGKLFLNDEPLEVGLLKEALSQKMDSSGEQSVILKADARVSHGSVIEVMDILKGMGIQKMIISTKYED